MARFKLLAGHHSSGSGKDGTRKIIKKGDIFETHTDKETKFCESDKNKYERLSEPVAFRRTVAPATAKTPEIEEVEVDIAKLDNMTTEELVQFAKEYGLDIKGASTRQQVLKNVKDELNKL